MKVLLINGSPRSNGCTARTLEEVETVLKEEGIETETIVIGTKIFAVVSHVVVVPKQGNVYLTIWLTKLHLNLQVRMALLLERRSIMQVAMVCYYLS